MTGTGRRQITSFQLAGDVPDLLSLHLARLDSGVQTLTACRVGFVLHEHLRQLCRKAPGVQDALWRISFIDASVSREWVANIGQRPALARVAHILCEIVTRLQVVGLADESLSPFPITQQELADATGLTSIHLNRTIQTLRRQAITELKSGTLTICDAPALIAAADFDPAYLHLAEPRLTSAAMAAGR